MRPLKEKGALSCTAGPSEPGRSDAGHGRDGRRWHDLVPSCLGSDLGLPNWALVDALLSWLSHGLYLQRIMARGESHTLRRGYGWSSHWSGEEGLSIIRAPKGKALPHNAICLEPVVIVSLGPKLFLLTPLLLLLFLLSLLSDKFVPMPSQPPRDKYPGSESHRDHWFWRPSEKHWARLWWVPEAQLGFCLWKHWKFNT